MDRKFTTSETITGRKTGKYITLFWIYHSSPLIVIGRYEMLIANLLSILFFCIIFTILLYFYINKNILWILWDFQAIYFELCSSLQFLLSTFLSPPIQLWEDFCVFVLCSSKPVLLLLMWQRSKNRFLIAYCSTHRWEHFSIIYKDI